MSTIIGNISYTNLTDLLFYFILIWRDSPQWARASSFMRFLDHTKRRTTVVRTPLDERSARRTDPYLTTYNTHKGQTSTPLAGFEPTVSAGERLQPYVLNRAANRTGDLSLHNKFFQFFETC